MTCMAWMVSTPRYSASSLGHPLTFFECTPSGQCYAGIAYPGSSLHDLTHSWWTIKYMMIRINHSDMDTNYHMAGS